MCQREPVSRSIQPIMKIKTVLVLFLACVLQATAQTLPPTSRLINMSLLATASNSPLIAGFVITGSGPKTLLIRGVGPGLASYVSPKSIASNVKLSILGVPDVVVPVALTWTNPAHQSAIANVAAEVGAFPITPGSQDAVQVVTVAPGAYTAQVSGNGVVLVEVYEVPQ